MELQYLADLKGMIFNVDVTKEWYKIATEDGKRFYVTGTGFGRHRTAAQSFKIEHKKKLTNVTFSKFDEAIRDAFLQSQQAHAWNKKAHCEAHADRQLPVFQQLERGSNVTLSVQVKAKKADLAKGEIDGHGFASKYCGGTNTLFWIKHGGFTLKKTAPAVCIRGELLKDIRSIFESTKRSAAQTLQDLMEKDIARD